MLHESRRIPKELNRFRGAGTALALCLVGLSSACAAAGAELEAPAMPAEAERVEVDLSRHFQALGADGAFVLSDPRTDRLVVHGGSGTGERYLPASTFKILNSLIALETGALADEHEIIPWDGVDRGEWWNGDQAMTRAFQRSTVWFYQEVARRVGEERMRRWVERVGYGNQDVRGGVDRFWLDGELRISAEEQVDLLRRLHAGTLPFSDRSQEIVRRVMLMEEGAGYVLRGKTGWTRQGRGEGVEHTAWLVGWVERGEEVWFFATRIASRDPEFPARRAQQEITRGALRELGVLP
jgi:beta-lactamase class D